MSIKKKTLEGFILAALEYMAVFMFGSVIYGMIEIIVRGFTHWSMIICGGICLSMLYSINVLSRDTLWKKWIMGMCVITAVEFITGIIVNLKLGMDVWDYSGYKYNLLGQICPRFSFYWLALSIPGFEICRLIRQFFGSKRFRFR